MSEMTVSGLEPQLAECAALLRRQAFIGHESDDNRLPVAWAHRGASWLGAGRETRLYPGDHGIPPPTELDDFFAWLQRVSSSPGD